MKVKLCALPVIRFNTASHLSNAGACKGKTCRSLTTAGVTILCDRTVYSVPDVPHSWEQALC